MNNVSFFVQRTIFWDDKTQSVKLIDQTHLPFKLELVTCRKVSSLVNAIKVMQIRGAPAIGVAGAMGVALAVLNTRTAKTKKEVLGEIQEPVHHLKMARPTAINLKWGIDEALGYLNALPKNSSVETIKREIIAFVKSLADKDVLTNKRLSKIGQELIPNKASVLTHCN